MIGAIIFDKNRPTEIGGFMALDTFGKRLRVLRIDREMSQIDLRDRMDKSYGVKIGETYISELERTDKMPTLQVAAAMARALETSLDYLGLLTEDSTAPYQRTPPPEYFSPEADEVAHLVDTMRPDQRDVVLNVARGLFAPTQRQREQAEMRAMLDSVERDAGIDTRKKVEKILRAMGLLRDTDT